MHTLEKVSSIPIPKVIDSEAGPNPYWPEDMQDELLSHVFQAMQTVLSGECERCWIYLEDGSELVVDIESIDRTVAVWSKEFATKPVEERGIEA